MTTTAITKCQPLLLGEGVAEGDTLSDGLSSTPFVLLTSIKNKNTYEDTHPVRNNSRPRACGRGRPDMGRAFQLGCCQRVLRTNADGPPPRLSRPLVPRRTRRDCYRRRCLGRRVRRHLVRDTAKLASPPRGSSVARGRRWLVNSSDHAGPTLGPTVEGVWRV